MGKVFLFLSDSEAIPSFFFISVFDNQAGVLFSITPSLAQKSMRKWKEKITRGKLYKRDLLLYA